MGQCGFVRLRRVMQRFKDVLESVLNMGASFGIVIRIVRELKALSTISMAFSHRTVLMNRVAPNASQFSMMNEITNKCKSIKAMGSASGFFLDFENDGSRSSNSGFPVAE
eukprot:Gregarina_sp_Poly_1__6077@NODE_3207_length_1276_cov_3_145575_g2037_i0_p3_GENE_NODE_3207_length_1276_cov_3_145575_g2037_i0NODE_3207_length_1276_cov_3_145575_g2037_i0_p3_ORF_typecomplete_len110_score7_26Ribul_P_3_epim/PF00834_19/0_048_NODE_3207_length_1276_cov_3_145575_g2037_i0188517